jgi:probable HAF family extracellular repeat protein
MKIKMSILAFAIGLVLIGQAQAAFFKGLGDIPDGFQEATAYGMSADGQVVIGSGEGVYADEAFRWSFSGGMEGLGFLPGGDASMALAVSADGNVVVGYSSTEAGREAFRWTRADGMVGLGDLSGGTIGSIAHGVSADGSIVVGAGTSASGEEACIWVRGTLSNLKTYLTDQYGLNLSGWTLTAAKLVSADGKTIIGYGLNPDGNTEAWVAHLGDSTASSTLAPPTGLHIVFH